MGKVKLSQIIDINKASDSKFIHRKNKETEKILLELRREFEKPYQNIFRTNYKIRNNSFLLYAFPKLSYYKKQKKSWKDKAYNILEWLKLIVPLLCCLSKWL